LPETGYDASEMATTQPVLEAASLIADTEEEILRVLGNHDSSTAGVYDMIRYHLGLDGSGASAGKRMRPVLGLLAYASIAGDYRPALPGAAAVELGHNFSLVHDDIGDGDRERRHRPTVWALHGGRARQGRAVIAGNRGVREEPEHGSHPLAGRGA